MVGRPYGLMKRIFTRDALHAGNDVPSRAQRGFFRADGQCDVGAYEAGAVVFVPSQWVYLPLAAR